MMPFLFVIVNPLADFFGGRVTAEVRAEQKLTGATKAWSWAAFKAMAEALQVN